MTGHDRMQRGIDGETFLEHRCGSKMELGPTCRHDATEDDIAHEIVAEAVVASFVGSSYEAHGDRRFQTFPGIDDGHRSDPSDHLDRERTPCDRAGSQRLHCGFREPSQSALDHCGYRFRHGRRSEIDPS